MDRISQIAGLITEDPDLFNKYQKKWEDKTVLSDDNYFQVVAILKDIVEKNKCILDYERLAVEFIPPVEK